VHFARIHAESDSTKYFAVAYSGVEIIYFEHETSD